MAHFSDEVVTAVTAHMNSDHLDDSLLIAKAFGVPEATASEMVGLDEHAGIWRVTDGSGTRELRVDWPGAPLAERADIRRDVVVLYKEACKRLGVEPRDEHARPPLSKVLREGTWSDHEDSEHATFMEDIMRGTATRQDYIDLVAQHYFMYEALEQSARQVSGDPAFVGFHPPALERLRTLEADLEHLIGDDWRDKIEAVPATAEYAARMREVGDEAWVAGVVAHHYTRYLGDLSGGQFIARRVGKQHDLSEAGISFYDFSVLGSLDDFKNAYRAELDRLGEQLSDEERTRMLDEVRAAYRFNTAVFIDLGKAKVHV